MVNSFKRSKEIKRNNEREVALFKKVIIYSVWLTRVLEILTKLLLIYPYSQGNNKNAKKYKYAQKSMNTKVFKVYV